MTYECHTIGVYGWHGLVRRDQAVSLGYETYTLYVFYDLLYRHPPVVGANLSALLDACYRLYFVRTHRATAVA